MEPPDAAAASKESGTRPYLQVLASAPRAFVLPRKEIDDGPKVEFWLQSQAHSDIMTFLLQLNIAMYPTTAAPTSNKLSPDATSPAVLGLQRIIARLTELIEDAPPDPGARRFGNISFRHWFTLVDTSAAMLLREQLPGHVTSFPSTSAASPVDELKKIFMGSFGSDERLDYGTGHELSFLAFLAGIWKLGGFEGAGADVERHIVLGVISPYFALVRKLILTYNLEPAGSHGVWGLDDHFFLPYVFGSAQLSPQITRDATTVPQEGSIKGAPKAGLVANKATVDDWRDLNLYFGAIGFINDVKTGPFWEHSPMLFDISGVKAGWAKINKGMLKMFQVEVLSKFPVVQHFPFGSLFEWKRDPKAAALPASIHTGSQPVPSAPGGTQAPWKPSAAPPQASTSRPSGAMPQTGAPWAANGTQPLPLRRPPTSR